MALMMGAAHAAAPATVIETDAYRWIGDTLYQDEFKAWAVNPGEIRSTYKGRPGYFMPVEQVWKRKNDLSAYPVLKEPNALLQAVYNMGLDEMVNAVEPDTTLRTGKEWAGVWTRDVSYSIILSMAALQPEASMISLLKKVNAEGQIIQDTGSGGAWPVSTDRMVWTLAAWEIYKVTGDRAWLEKVYPIIVRSIYKDARTIVSDNGLVKGETSFIDWREQSYPRWMQTADISQSEAMGTNMLYAAALNAASEMAAELDKKKEALEFAKAAADVSAAIDKTFWMADKGYHGMYTYGRDTKILNPRAETLGESLGILYDITPADKQRQVSEKYPVTPFGPAIFYPQIPDVPNYHNNALWPFVGSYWTLAQAKAGNEQATLQGLGSVVRPAALFATNKENFNLDNGDYFTELNSSNMLWSLSGNLALTNRILFGINFEKDGLLIKPFVPKSLAGSRVLENFPYRGARITVAVDGYGAKVKKLTIDGAEYPSDKVIPATMLANGATIKVEMDNKPIPAMEVNNVANKKAPMTPVAWLAIDETTASDSLVRMNQLQWNPIEYIGEYVVLCDGKEVGRTHSTTWPAETEGEWQVIGIAADGTPGFASEPRSNRRRVAIQPSAEKKTLSSKEVSYPVKGDITGYRGNGFAELDHATDLEAMPVELEEGTYSISFRYANGNGPVNTENKCAVRTLVVDGVERGTVVMPQRGVGNWDDWGMSNSIRVSLPGGKHQVKLEYGSDDENMNLSTNHAIVDEMIIERVSTQPF